jgi:uncharacterized protein
MSAVRVISPETARRLNISAQRLSDTSQSLLETVRAIGCVQIDPISVVTRTQYLVMWSRVGSYDPAQFDALLWTDRTLFEYWAHCASIVLTEDWQIFHHMMRTYATDNGIWSTRVREWIAVNHELRDHVLEKIRSEGAQPLDAFEKLEVEGWASRGWTNQRNVNRMIDYLSAQGTLMISGRKGLRKYWDLTDRFLPAWTPRDELPTEEVVYRAVQKSLKALGVGRAADIKNHFIRGHYPGLDAALKRLEADGCISRVQIRENGKDWAGTWYIHTDNVPRLDHIEAGGFEPRTVLLSPFDNLICDRKRTEKLFNFNFRIEIYVPKEKRQYGYYVLPILHGDRLIGRIDPQMDRKAKRLTVNAVYAEPDAPDDAGGAIMEQIRALAGWLGAKDVTIAPNVPKMWKKAIR